MSVLVNGISRENTLRVFHLQVGESPYRQQMVYIGHTCLVNGKAV